MPFVREGIYPPRFWSKVEKTDGCWLWQGFKDHDGYGVVGEGKRAHRISWELTNGEIEKGLWVLHRCNVRACVNPSHSYLGTNVENTRDRVQRGPVEVRRRFRRPGTSIHRFWLDVNKQEDGCWEWTGYCLPNGYGLFRWKGKRARVHRISWELATGQSVPEDMCVLHKCDNRKCVRPDHLLLGTRADNAADREAKGRGRPGRAGAPRGDLHPFRTHPECVARGENHGSKTHPERWVRGDRHWTRTNPEKIPRGEQHGSKTHPDAFPRGEECSFAKLTAVQVASLRHEHSEGATQTTLAKKYGISQTQVSRIVHGLRWSTTKLPTEGE